MRRGGWLRGLLRKERAPAWELAFLLLTLILLAVWAIVDRHRYDSRLFAVGAFGVVFLGIGAGLIYLQRTTALKSTRVRVALVLTGLILLAVLLRLPFFFPSTVGSDDESTFILVGQDLLNGHLPYTHLWDVKPPFVGMFFALCLSFAHSVVAVRVGGLLAVLLCATALYFLGTRLYDPESGVWAAILLIVYVSVQPKGQATLSEHIVLIPLAGLLLLAFRWPTLANSLEIGACFGAAVLVRTNMAVIFPWVLLAVVLRARGSPLHTRLRNATALIAGAIFPLATLMAIYAAQGELPLFLHSFIQAPLALPYVSLQSPLKASAGFLRLVSERILSREFPIWTAFGFGGLVSFRSARYEVRQNTKWLLGLLGLMGLSIALMEGDVGREYYLIVLLPVMALVGAHGIAVLLRRPRSWPLHVCVIVAILVPIRHMDYPGRYMDLATRLWRHQTLMSDQGYQVAEYLKEHGADGHYVYLCGGGFQLIYWLSGAMPTTRYADPSTLGQDGVIKAVEGPAASTETVWRAVMQRQPLFLVDDGCSHAGRWRGDHAEEIMDAYRFETTIGRANIFRRRTPGPTTP